MYVESDAKSRYLMDIVPGTTLRQYVVTTEDILINGKNHGIIGTDIGWFVITSQTSIDPFELAIAAEKFRDEINRYNEEQKGWLEKISS